MTVIASAQTPEPLVFQRFRRELGDLWTEVGPHCHSAHDPSDLLATLRTQEEAASHLAPELEALLAGWPHYDESRRAILTGAVAYLADEGDDEPREETAADEVVVRAAVRAILRHR